MFTGISRGGRALPCAVWSIIRTTASATQGSAALHTSARQQSEAGAPVLVVQDRSQSQLQTEEALRLAQTYTGKHKHGSDIIASTTTAVQPDTEHYIFCSVQCTSYHCGCAHVRRQGMQGGEGWAGAGAAAASEHLLWQGRRRLVAAAHRRGQAREVRPFNRTACCKVACPWQLQGLNGFEAAARCVRLLVPPPSTYSSEPCIQASKCVSRAYLLHDKCWPAERQLDVHRVVVNAALSGVQHRNLEQALR